MLCLMQNVADAERSHLRRHAGGDEKRGHRSLARGIRPGG
jgi:hypothetical protein